MLYAAAGILAIIISLIINNDILFGGEQFHWQDA